MNHSTIRLITASCGLHNPSTTPRAHFCALRTEARETIPKLCSGALRRLQRDACLVEYMHEAAAFHAAILE